MIFEGKTIKAWEQMTDRYNHKIIIITFTDNSKIKIWGDWSANVDITILEKIMPKYKSTFDGNEIEAIQYFPGAWTQGVMQDDDGDYVITKCNGEKCYLKSGDYLIKESENSFHSIMNPDDFEHKYREV